MPKSGIFIFTGGCSGLLESTWSLGLCILQVSPCLRTAPKCDHNPHTVFGQALKTLQSSKRESQLNGIYPFSFLSCSPQFSEQNKIKLSLPFALTSGLLYLPTWDESDQFAVIFSYWVQLCNKCQSCIPLMVTFVIENGSYIVRSVLWVGSAKTTYNQKEQLFLAEGLVRKLW